MSPLENVRALSIRKLNSKKEPKKGSLVLYISYRIVLLMLCKHFEVPLCFDGTFSR